MAISMQQLGNMQLLGLITLSILILNGGLSLYLEHYKRSLFSAAKAGQSVFGKEHVASAAKKGNLGEEVFKTISKN
jgi:uncharacterized membrane-anchored protein